MITGTINRRHEAVITLLVCDSTGQRHNLDTILDTGFNGSLTLPTSIIDKLDLEWRSRSSAALANGTLEDCDVYAATVVWDGAERSILVQAMENVPLLGMAMLIDHDLRARVVVGGTVEIEAIR
jgi:clan AA aspartic protease